MPELPDIVVYVERLNELFAGHRIEKLIIRSPFVLRTFDPDIQSAEGQTVIAFHRQAKRIVWELSNGLWLVFHLMVTGRFHMKKPGFMARGKNDLVTLQFEHATLVFTEVSKKRRAALYCFANHSQVQELDRGGIEPLDCSDEEFSKQLLSENHTLKRALTDPRLFSGIGNAYSDEILHRAKLSPIKWTSRLSKGEIARLHQAVVETLDEWTQRLREQVAGDFPKKVTAFHPKMSVHGRYGKPCPVCESPVQRIQYADNETNYCATCQNDGKLLADRVLSRLLKDDWPQNL